MAINDFNYDKLDSLSSESELQSFLMNLDLQSLTSENCRAIGLQCNSLKLLESAVFWYSKSLQKNKSAFVYFYRGMANQKLGAIVDAVQDYESVIEIDSFHETRPFVLLHMSYCYLKLGLLKDAKNRILELKDNYENFYPGKFDDFSVYCGGLISAKKMLSILV